MITLHDIQAEFHSIRVGNGSGNFLAIDGSGNISAIVSATNLDIRDLAFATDSVTAHQGGTWTVGINSFVLGGNALVVNADGSLNVKASAAGFASWQVSKTSVSTTAVQLAATPLTGRTKIVIENLGNKDIFIAPTNAVSTNALQISKGAVQEIELDASADVYAITASGTSDIRVAEYAI